MDTSDEKLIEQLKQDLLGSGAKTAFGDERPQTPGPAEKAIGEDDFFEAMNAFRSAKASGDSAAVAAAEKHLQDVVRAEMIQQESCQQ